MKIEIPNEKRFDKEELKKAFGENVVIISEPCTKTKVHEDGIEEVTYFPTVIEVEERDEDHAKELETIAASYEPKELEVETKPPFVETKPVESETISALQEALVALTKRVEALEGKEEAGKPKKGLS